MLRFVLPALLVASPALGQTIVSQTDTSPYPGITVRALRTSGPATNAWATFVDLCADGIHLEATSSPTSLRTTGTWATATGVQLAINGDFYATSPTIHVYGQAAGGGALWPVHRTGTSPDYAADWYYGKYGYIAVGRDWIDFSHSELVKKQAAALGVTQGFEPTSVSHAVPPGTLALVSGFPELVTEGTPVTCSSPTVSTCFPDRTDMRSRHPRTAIGLTRDRRTLILLVVDGRTTSSAGMYGTELAHLMGLLGAWQAFNLDGGGSTQLWQQGKGYLNDEVGNNLGNPARSVGNHWGVFAGTGHSRGKTPGHCLDRLAQAQAAPPRHDAPEWLDFDGDGKADVCLRTSAGLSCARGSALGTSLDTGLFKDADGWNAIPRYTSIRYGDLDGDGRTDVCARAASGVLCWRSTAVAPFSVPFTGPALTDTNGWASPAYGSTLRLVDVTGDGKADLCARAANGVRCYPSTGQGFGAAFLANDFTDSDGFAAADKFPTLRFGDLDGDGKADVCGRTAAGIRCRLSTGTGFGGPFNGPAWTDASGFEDLRYWSSLRMGDVDGDGRADLCIRTSTDLRCHLSTGSGFGPPVIRSGLGDGSGWSDRSNNFTLRLGDIDGDGDLDLCARANAGVRCWPWTGSAFGAAVVGPALSDAAGFDDDRFYETLRLTDVNGDGRADVCVRDGVRLRCWLSDGAGFPTQVNGPAWAGVGFEHPSVFHTLATSALACRPTPEVCNGLDDDCDGLVDEGGVCAPDAGTPDAGTPDAGEAVDAGMELDAGGHPAEDPADAGADAGPGQPPVAGCDGCSSTGGSLPLVLLVGLLGLALRSRCGAPANIGRRGPIPPPG